MIAILKYNAGNIKSVGNALSRLGYSSVITDDPAELIKAEKVIFPGVGEASSAMHYLKEKRLDKTIFSLKQPVLGICLGLQLMCTHTEEGDTKCLDIFKTNVKLFPPVDKIPHMGWNNFLSLKGELFKGISTEDDVYYVHSYYPEICQLTVATCDYILPFSAAIQFNNFYATQFHPEKSAGVGEKNPAKLSGAMRIIVAIDIIDGKCVRLTRGNFNSKKIYSEDPLEIAKQVESNGIKYLHLVDLDGAKNKSIGNIRILEKIANGTSLRIDFGGGIRSLTDVKTILNTGALQVTAGSIAVTHPAIFLDWLKELGPEKIILGADCVNRKISTGGWLDKSDKDIISFISGYKDMGVKYTICTDIDKDGMLQGPATELYKEILSAVKINIIASGGVSSLRDIEDLKQAGCEGAIIGKAVYEGKITLNELGELC